MALQNRDNLSVDLFGVQVKVKQCAIQSVAVSKVLGFVLPAGVKVFTAAAAASSRRNMTPFSSRHSTSDE